MASSEYNYTYDNFGRTYSYKLPEFTSDIVYVETEYNPISGNWTIETMMNAGGKMSYDNRLEGYYGKDKKLYFKREYSHQPFTVRDTASPVGNKIAEVHEVGKGDGLGINDSRWSILSGGEVVYPWYTWTELIKELENKRDLR